MAKKTKNPNRTNRRALFAGNVAYTQHIAQAVTVNTLETGTSNRIERGVSGKGGNHKTQGAALAKHHQKERDLSDKIFFAKREGKNLAGGQGQTTGTSQKSLELEQENRRRKRATAELLTGKRKLQAAQKMTTKNTAAQISKAAAKHAADIAAWNKTLELLGTKEALQLAVDTYTGGSVTRKPEPYQTRKNARGVLVVKRASVQRSKDTSDIDRNVRTMLSTKTEAMTGNRRRTTAGRDSLKSTSKRNKRSK